MMTDKAAPEKYSILLDEGHGSFADTIDTMRDALKDAPFFIMGNHLYQRMTDPRYLEHSATALMPLNYYNLVDYCCHYAGIRFYCTKRDKEIRCSPPKKLMNEFLSLCVSYHWYPETRIEDEVLPRSSGRKIIWLTRGDQMVDDIHQGLKDFPF